MLPFHEKFVVTTELNPPKGTDLAPLLAKAESLRGAVDGFNLTDSHTSRMSMSPLAAAARLADAGLTPILQMTCRDRNRIALQADAGTGVRVATGAGLAALARSPGAHKGDFGRLLIVGGDADMGGAVLLAGEAALRAGAGLVTIATRAAHRPAILARRPELMVRAVEAAQDLRQAAQSATAIVVGPGLGRGAWSRLALTECLTAAAPLVVDADGLNLLADDAGPSLSDLPEGSIVTPHPGEAGRLLGSDAAAVQGGRPGAAVALSANGVVAVLKGAGTLVAEDGALRAICLRGNPHMATAGSGDVLSGVIGALRARGLPAGEAAELGVWLHARAGDEAAAGRESAVLAGDIAAALRLTS